MFEPGCSLRRGFTWIELLIVLALFCIVAAIAVPLLEESREAAKVAKAIGDLRAIEAQIDIFELSHERLPYSLEEVSMAHLSDPWENPYQYLAFAFGDDKAIRRDRNLRPLNTAYDLYSMGKDGDSKPALTAQASWDDVVRANDGAFFDLAEKY